MARLFVLSCLLLLVTACAERRSYQSDLDGMIGQPVDAAARQFGAPSGQYMKAGTLTYIWEAKRRDSLFSPVGPAGRAYMNTPTIDDGGVPWTGMAYDSCVVRATTTNNIIQNIGYEGPPSACATLFGHKQ